ncbi:MAG TPA: HAMP domain-containing sensor histidine kinase [Flavobacteriales bacterium]|nr:HAMP domain-containing sensor histidine kinase [Flavobacteriales bacterium]
MLNSLFWKVSAIYLALLLVFTAIVLKIHIAASSNHALEVTQRLNHDLAQHTVGEIKPFLNGEVTEEAIGTLMHSMMAVNPGIEVYVLDTAGAILKYVALEGEVKSDRVDLAPVRDFIAKKEHDGLLVGDDPRAPGERKIFSAAPVLENGVARGYVYIILAGQEYVGATETLFGSYFLRLGGRSVLIALAFTLVFGLLAIWFITQNIERVLDGIRRFRAGERDVRIEHKGNGQFAQVATTFNDMATTIERNMDELKGLDKLRKELIANVSHDLRTPIAAVQGYAETLLLKEGTLSPEERREHLGIIVKSTDRLKELVDDLFTLSKLEAGQVKLDLEPISLGELVHDVVNKLRLHAQKKSVGLNIIMAKDLPIVEVDVKKIDRVLQNIIQNSIKFCGPGDRITVELDGNTEGVDVRISDTGPGIPADELPFIFDRYYRGRRSSTSEGSGLGLAIVKRIVELHGSTVKAISRANEGAQFSFSLLARKAA